MSITPIYSVHCDNCCNWIGEDNTKKLVWKYAKSYKWKRVKIDNEFQYLCPDCYQKYLNGETVCK